mgnify:CR=1 FL=1
MVKARIRRIILIKIFLMLFLLILLLTAVLELCDDKHLLEIVELGYRYNLSRFCHIVGISGKLLGVAHQDSRQEHIADIGCDNFIALLNISFLLYVVKTEKPFFIKRQISADDAVVSGAHGHAADAAGIINDRADSGVIGANVGDNAHQAASAITFIFSLIPSSAPLLIRNI